MPREQTGRAGLSLGFSRRYAAPGPAILPQWVWAGAARSCPPGAGYPRSGPVGATLRAVALGFPRWRPVLRSSMDTPGDRQAGTQQLPATQSSLQPVTFHPSLRQHARESQNILPIPRDGVWGGRTTPKWLLCGEGAAVGLLLTEKPGKMNPHPSFKKFPFKWEKVIKLLKSPRRRWRPQ